MQRGREVLEVNGKAFTAMRQLWLGMIHNNDACLCPHLLFSR